LSAPSANIGRGEWIRTTDPSVPNRAANRVKSSAILSLPQLA
jgi:hypothetical protein